MSDRIAIVGMACRYPDAASPIELWANVLAGRRAFRRLPTERLRLEDYWSADRTAPDCFYTTKAAVIEGYEFDRVAHRIAGSTFRSTDLAQWLALDVAGQALADAGFPAGADLPRTCTGVLVGNTLTGEISRANALRLRWPYVRRVTAAALQDAGWTGEPLRQLLVSLEERFKAPFPRIDGDTLAGGLSNTIAGRICNHFDLGGGGYTVDGACSSSLLSVTTACAALASGDLDVAIAGGVDVSIDPFELVGFAKAGALAENEMRVYDRRSSGFWPGEGCGMVVLMRAEDAVSQGRPIYALICGWGISSDGSGGLTRPEADGQLLAVERAYRRAGFGIDTVEYFEGHGTGTAIGDHTELEVLSHARRAVNAGVAAIGTIKANIGHTKAAAGIAGLINATLAVGSRVLPPTTGCIEPHPLLCEPNPTLRVLARGEPWPAGRPARAAVSSMGFGGINVHVALDAAPSPARQPKSDILVRDLLASPQDAELFLIDADSVVELASRVRQLASAVSGLSFAELTDLAASLERTLAGHTVRAGLVATSPEELQQRLACLDGWLHEGVERRIDPAAGVFLGVGAATPRLVYLFPGQGSGAHCGPDALRSRFDSINQLCASIALPYPADPVATEFAQPHIVTASLAGLRALGLAGVEASAAVGHSLGELTALHWTGAIDEHALVRIATTRGRLMASLGEPDGAMASLAATPEDVAPLLSNEAVVVACYNGPRQTVVSGHTTAVAEVMAAAERRGFSATPLSVSHAFHSPLLAPAAAALGRQLADEQFRPLERTVVSTVTGGPLAANSDLRELLRTQVTGPVRFLQALQVAAADADLLLEVGPGEVLSRLAQQQTTVPVVALSTNSASLVGFLGAVGAAFALGHPIRHQALFVGRFHRPLDLNRERRFLRNPCESAPPIPPPPPTNEEAPAVSDRAGGADTLPTIELLRRLVASHAELPVTAVGDTSRLLDELHLSSIAVGQIVVEACRQLGTALPTMPSAYATTTLSEIAGALDSLRAADPARERPTRELEVVPGVAPWIRAFSVALVETQRPAVDTVGRSGSWHVIAPDNHPLALPLRLALERSGVGNGVLVCLPGEAEERHLELLLRGARLVLAPGGPRRFVLLQVSGGGAAFAKTLHLEAPQVKTTVVDVPLAREAVQWVVAEVAATSGFAEAHYDRAGVRRVPVLRPLVTYNAPGPGPIGPDDVLLVTGGGKGITAECALALGRDTGARLGLLGRADPALDESLAANLRRMEALGVRLQYVRADVTDEATVHRAVADLQATLGTVTGVLHGAGSNVPALLDKVDQVAFRQTIAPKVTGLEALLRAVDRRALRVLVTFGSIIGRAGMGGEAAYAVANEWMTRLTEKIRTEQPGCRCLAIEWSVWSGVGMGERLGVVEALAREGITPIGPDEGVAMLRELLAAPAVPSAVVVTGRIEGLSTMQLEARDLPLLRFLERPRIHYPGVELVSDAELSPGTDPYLDDHVLGGQRVLPAVIGMEALAQVASAVTGASSPAVLEQVEFTQPVVIAADRVRVRVAALVREPGVVETVLRSSETGFEVDHFRAVCRFPAQASPTPPLEDAANNLPAVPLEPGRDLYGGVLFQSGRFRRVRRYRLLHSTRCVAELDGGDATGWFGPYLPAGLILGDPGLRDACMHAVQCCVPDTSLVPVAVERLVRHACPTGSAPVLVHAQERAHNGDQFTYDLIITDDRGEVLERWDGLELRSVRGLREQGPLPTALLGPYLERRLAELAPAAGAAVVVDPVLGLASASRRTRSDRALQRALGRRVAIHHRVDGRPEVGDGGFVSAAHTDHLTMAVASHRPIACDVEAIIERSMQVWEGLVGAEGIALARRITNATGEEKSAALTRIWSAAECIQKMGRWSVSPLRLLSVAPDGWVVVAVGTARIATLVTSLSAVQGHITVAILTEGEDHAWTSMNTTTWSGSKTPTSSATSTT
jgi:enediyne polyketide synthase